MFPFIESLRLEEGKIVRLAYHNKRLNQTRRELLGLTDSIDLKDYISIPSREGRIKCRVEYSTSVGIPTYTPYQLRPVQRLKLVESDLITYCYKSVDRRQINDLFAQRGEADDVLIVRHGCLTDTSICNIALWNGSYWATPDKPLLPGTHRAALLDEGMICAETILVDSLEHYSRIRLFNAMIDFGEIDLPLSCLCR